MYVQSLEYSPGFNTEFDLGFLHYNNGNNNNTICSRWREKQILSLP